MRVTVALELLTLVHIAERPRALQHGVVVDGHLLEPPEFAVEYAGERELAVGERLQVTGAGDDGAVEDEHAVAPGSGAVRVAGGTDTRSAWRSTAHAQHCATSRFL